MRANIIGEAKAATITRAVASSTPRKGHNYGIITHPHARPPTTRAHPWKTNDNQLRNGYNEVAQPKGSPAQRLALHLNNAEGQGISHFMGPNIPRSISRIF